MIVFDMGKGAIGVSVFLGLQAVLAGIGFIILAFLKRFVVKKNERIDSGLGGA